jgi:hypothetical protein
MSPLMQPEVAVWWRNPAQEPPPVLNPARITLQDWRDVLGSLDRQHISGRLT